MRFKKNGKLALKYISPYEIVEQVGKVACKLVLSKSRDCIHNVSHVLSLRKYIKDLSYVLRIEEIKLLDNLSYEERPVQIIDKRIR